MKSTKIKFINHASVVVSSENISILTDPWYSGGAFHKGWNLLFENSTEDIFELLNHITHIWISHEHPDHFSIPFFKKYGELIRTNKITILFQMTFDQRVVSFLKANNFLVKEIPFEKKVSLDAKFNVYCIKDGFYDSALFIENEEDRILNLNDCEINNKKRALEIFELTGPVDVLLSQFSYAAWKGGKHNNKWRKNAAKDKIDTLKLQIRIFSPKVIIPFASYIYFSNENNFYINDSVNTPKDIFDKVEEDEVAMVVMKPNDVLDKIENVDVLSAINFWEEKYLAIKTNPLQSYRSVNFDELKKVYLNYCDRICENNNIKLMKIVRLLSPVRVFKPVSILLEDTQEIIEFDYLAKRFFRSKNEPMLKMHSESLLFLFQNSFGFDTLTVNGCFEECKRGGFTLASRSLAIENLNNLGFHFNGSFLFKFRLIKMFLLRLYRVARKIES